jgi:predicted enzyme related to lactoylglutathione lyase
MTQNVHALRMFIWLAPKESRVDTFYEETIGLPLVRRIGNHGADIYWAGEATVIETIYVAGKTPTPDATPDAAAMSPILRVEGLDGLVDRLSTRGVPVTRIETRGLGREAYFQDTDGHWTGLRERNLVSTQPHDLEARRRARRGEAFNPGCKSMPQGIQELGWVVRRVEDVKAMTTFLRTALGLVPFGEEAGHLLFDLGDNVVLELAGGGRCQTVPKDRYEASSIVLLRVADIAQLRQSIPPAGGHIVNERIPIHWADLMYFADPEGALLGAEQGLHPGLYAPEKFVLPEALEAERRWRELVATNSADFQ